MWSDITTTTTRLFGATSKEGFALNVISLSLAIFALISLWQRGMRSVALLLVSVGLVPFLLELLVSYLAMPIFVGRTLIYVNIPLYVAAAYGLTQLPVTFWRIFGVVMFGMLVVSLGSYFNDFHKE